MYNDMKDTQKAKPPFMILQFPFINLQVYLLNSQWEEGYQLLRKYEYDYIESLPH